MTPEERAEVGDFAGQTVDTGVEAEAFSRYIGGHLEGINEGKTYSETSAAAREEGLDPEVAAELQGKADSLFKGETLRSILPNAYGCGRSRRSRCGPARPRSWVVSSSGSWRSWVPPREEGVADVRGADEPNLGLRAGGW